MTFVDRIVDLIEERLRATFLPRPAAKRKRPPAPFKSFRAWRAWCEQDRRDEALENMLWSIRP